MNRFLPVLLALCAGAAQAEFKDGNRWLSDYRTATGEVANAAALGYVQGVADTTYGVIHCAPGNTTAGQLADMTKQFLEVFPERRSHSADSVILGLLKATWPCPKRNNL